MRKNLVRFTVWLVAVFAFAFATRADSLLNTFDVPFDYVTGGIVGDTNWDGVYLRSGDVPSGSEGWGTGETTYANTTLFPGYLGVQSIFTDWSGADDDGFFLYKVVKGDFDMSVENVAYNLSGVAGYDNRSYHFAGLLVRAYNTNNSGAPFSTTVPGTENFIQLWRFNEYDVDGQIRYSTNGVNQELGFPGSNTEILSSRFFRITRVGDVFTFYVKTNASDAWWQVTNGLAAGTLTRGDWSGVPLQVGIAQAAFSDQTRDAVFDNFSLSGPGVVFPSLPTAPSNLRATGTNIGGALTLSWDLGTAGHSSLVVMSRRPIQHNPIHGMTYVASAVFGDTSALLGGGGEFVVYNGSGTSVTVTNLGANVLNYYVAVYEYTGSGASTIYSTAAPAAGILPGPGAVISATIVAPITTIPVNGAAPLKLVATFSTGEVNVDQTTLATWTSGDPSVATVAANGTVSGMNTGSALITATFGKFAPSVPITVKAAPVFADNFGTTQDYLASGLVGSTWDGLFLKRGDIPGGASGTDGNGETTVLLAQTNGLSMTSLQSTWQEAGDDGPFLYKRVSGDFQAVVHVTSMNNLNYTSVGLMARLFDAAHAGPGPGDAENHVNYWKVQNGTTSVRKTEGGSTTTILTAGPSAANGWLLLQRVNSTNFYCFEKSTAGGEWILVASTVLDAAAANAPMEVGVAQQTLSGVNGIAVLDSFSLDATGIVSPTGDAPPAAATNLTAVLGGDLSMTFSWTTAWLTNNVTAAGSILVMRAGGPVTAQPTYGLGLNADPVFGAGQDLSGGNYVVYKSADYPNTTANSVTVKGLTPGVVYYVAVYTFTGPAGTRVFNNLGISTNLQDGQLVGLDLVPTPPIPLGGIGSVEVYGLFSGGGRVAIGGYADIASEDSSVIVTKNGVLTGVGLGSTKIKVSYSAFTNNTTVTVRAPGFSDNFSGNHDYLVAGVTGTGWDGAYRQGVGVNEVPHSPYAPGADLGTATVDANISSNNCLTVNATSDGWENDAVGGLFLFKYVPGDFQMAVHINSYDIAGYNQPGLMARAYSTGTNGTTLGAPFNIGPKRTNTADITIEIYGETWVSLTRFDEFGIGSYARKNVDSAVSQNTQPDQDDGNFWLLISRKGTEFDFYKRANSTDPWVQLPNKTHYSIAELAGVPMQVGLMAGPWHWSAGDNRTVRFENFMLDATTGSTLHAAVSGASITLTWPPDPNARLQSSVSLNPAVWKNVSGTPVLGAKGYSLTLPITGSTSFFRLAP